MTQPSPKQIHNPNEVDDELPSNDDNNNNPSLSITTTSDEGAALLDNHPPPSPVTREKSHESLLTATAGESTIPPQSSTPSPQSQEIEPHGFYQDDNDAHAIISPSRPPPLYSAPPEMQGLLRDHNYSGHHVEYLDEDEDDDKNNFNQRPFSSSLSANPRSASRRKVHTGVVHNNKYGKHQPHAVVGLLPEDSFSFFVTVPLASKAFWVAVGSVAVQILVLTFMSWDSISLRNGDNDVPQNWLNVPRTSVLQVSLSQFLALMIASVSQNDCLESVLLLFYGYREREIRQLIAALDDQSVHRRERYQPRNLKFRWYLSISLRFFVGFFTIIVTFMLVAQSDTVRNVMLDFTAVEFISQLDDTAYLLSTFGLFGRDVKRETESFIYDSDAFVTESSSHGTFSRHKCIHHAVRAFLRTLLFWVSTALLLFIVVGQYTGRYVPKTLLVQMGDESDPLLSTYSGLYELRIPSMGMFEYAERGGNGMFIWCDAERAWTFIDRRVIDGDGNNVLPGTSRKDCAETWRVKSTELSQFNDILTVADQPWYVAEQNNIKLEAEYVRVVSMLGVETSCDHLGEDLYGWTCTFQDPCEQISVDATIGPFVNRRGSWPTMFTRIPNVTVYERPVYYYRENEERDADLVIFIGRRWALLSTNNWTDDDEVIMSNETLFERLDQLRVYDFRGDFGVGFLSEYVNVGTIKDRGSPVGLRWFAAEAGTDVLPDVNERIVVPNVFFCATCNGVDRTCLYGAACVNGRCICDGDNLGARCEVIPASNGYCNPTFNRKAYDFDGGDCCSLTCPPAANFTCLKSKNNLIDWGNSRCRNRLGNYRRRLTLEQPDFTADWPNAVTVAPGISLTKDGRTAALSYRVVDRTSFITMIGNTWRDTAIFHQFGGYYNEIASLFPGSIGGPVRRLPIKGLAASYLKRDLTAYTCDGLGCTAGLIGDDISLLNTVVPPDFGLEDYWDPFTLSSDGRVLARGVAMNASQYDTTEVLYFVDLYVRDTSLVWLHSNQTVDLAINRTELSHTSLVEAPCMDVSGLTLYEFLEVTGLNITTVLNGTNVTASDIIQSAGFTMEEFFNSTNLNPDGRTVSNAELLEFIQTTQYSLSSFLLLSDFNETEYGLLFCHSEPVYEEIPVYVESTYRGEAPMYLSLSGLRDDGTRRLAVGSILFNNRSKVELHGPLATRVYEISNRGVVSKQGPAVKVLDVSDRHGKSSNAAIGIPKKSVFISEDGDVLAVGSIYFKKDENGTVHELGLVKVFEWRSDDWTLRQALELGRNDTDPELSNGWSNLLSADGSVLAVSFPLRSSIYRWNGTSYVLESDEIPFGSGTDVAVSLDAIFVGFAAPLRARFGAFMYRNDRAPFCPDNKNALRISYTPINEISFQWRMISPDGELVANDGWPPQNVSEPLDPIPESRRRMQIDVETDEYGSNDPSDLTFVYNLCINRTICPEIYRNDTIGDEKNLGVVYRGFIVNATTPILNVSCRLEFEATPREVF